MPRTSLPLSAFAGLLLSALLLRAGGQAAGGEPTPAAPLPAPPGPAETGADRTLERAFEVLSLRVRAALLEAEILRAAGRLDEALAAVRSAEQRYLEGLPALRTLLGAVHGAAAEPDEDAADLLNDEGPSDRLGLGPLRARWEAWSPRVGTGPPRRDREACRHALRWLSALQAPDGRFPADGFGRWCDGRPSPRPPSERPGGAGDPALDLLCTGAALTAFTACGFSNRGDHEFARPIALGLAALRRAQQPDGAIGLRSHADWPRAHAIATLALVEAYGLTGSHTLKHATERALSCLSSLRLTTRVQEVLLFGNESVADVCWLTLPLVCAQRINAAAEAEGVPPLLRLDDRALEGLPEWLRASAADAAVDGARPDPASPAKRARARPATAAATALRLLLGQDPARDPALGADLARVVADPARWEPGVGLADLDQAVFGSLVAGLAGGARGDDGWSDLRRVRLPQAQRLDTDTCLAKGSWDALDPAYARHGRVFATAMLVRVLQAPTLFRAAAPAAAAPAGR